MGAQNWRTGSNGLGDESYFKDACEPVWLARGIHERLGDDMSELAQWESFYVIIASAAGTLIGLQFVVLTLLADRPPTLAAGAAFATPNIVHFGAVLLLSGRHDECGIERLGLRSPESRLSFRDQSAGLTVDSHEGRAVYRSAR